MSSGLVSGYRGRVVSHLNGIYLFGGVLLGGANAENGVTIERRISL